MHRKEIGGPGGCVVSHEAHTPRGEIGGPGGCVVSNEAHTPRGEIGGPGGCVVSNEAHTPRGEIGGPGGCTPQLAILSFDCHILSLSSRGWPAPLSPPPACDVQSQL
ncbi:hypothetical protein PGT21_013776 [Puccinia graminis f. sp. tritici]|uniref:Uncharacterized protein n=1 Tax=Puccinia graminis f. sp. tritici TaxID=56615 RepID=A0A5B0MI05_PUCGR|nr:hypothetical protein PGT21_013776 [Puccinia graminis f. sp. tritici]KAA1075696.1 hypothetical protein PGTUg99_035268 [Puccinia graminis f. sp. tritici]